MEKELRPEIVMPTRADKSRVVAVAAGCTLLGAGIVMLLIDPTSPVVAPSEPAPAAAPRPVQVAPASAGSAAQPVAAPDPRSSELGFVFQAGGKSYLKLADLAATEAMPHHGDVQLFDDDGRKAAIAAVGDPDLPAADRRWRSRTVVVDGTCSTKIDGFAIVARVTGDPAYAGLAASETWTGANVLAHGTRVLAARLAGCTEGTFARDAKLPPIVIPEEIQDDELASAAKRLLLASPAARETQTDWIEHGGEGLWHMQSAITAQVLRHPRTGATWVSVHGHADHECGGPTVNVWGLFRVEPSGKLTTMQLRQLGDLESIEKVVDLEDDGQLELIGRPWLGLDLLATRADGAELARLGLQFYGCPC